MSRCEPEMTMMLPMSNHSSSADLRPENQILFGIMKLPTYYDPSLKAKDRLAVVKVSAFFSANSFKIYTTCESRIFSNETELVEKNTRITCYSRPNYDGIFYSYIRIYFFNRFGFITRKKNCSQLLWFI